MKTQFDSKNTSDKPQFLLRFVMMATVIILTGMGIYGGIYTDSTVEPKATKPVNDPLAFHDAGDRVVEIAPANFARVNLSVTNVPPAVTRTVIVEKPATYSFVTSSSNQPKIITEQQVRDMQEAARQKQKLGDNQHSVQ